MAAAISGFHRSTPHVATGWTPSRSGILARALNKLGLGGSGSDPQDVGDFFVRVALHIMEHGHGPHPRRQVPERILEAAAEQGVPVRAGQCGAARDRVVEAAASRRASLPLGGTGPIECGAAHLDGLHSWVW